MSLSRRLRRWERMPLMKKFHFNGCDNLTKKVAFLDVGESLDLRSEVMRTYKIIPLRNEEKDYMIIYISSPDEYLKYKKGGRNIYKLRNRRALYAES